MFPYVPLALFFVRNPPKTASQGASRAKCVGTLQVEMAFAGPWSVQFAAQKTHSIHPQVPFVPLAHRHCCQRLVPLRNLCCPPQSCQGEQGRQRSCCHPLPLPFDWMSYLLLGCCTIGGFGLLEGHCFPRSKWSGLGSMVAAYVHFPL